MNKIYIFPLIVVLLFLSGRTPAQDGQKAEIKISADLVNNFIFRGCPGYSSLADQNVMSMNIQPNLAFKYKNLEIGSWGSSDFTGSYKEVDLYATYAAGNISFTFTDYYWDLSWLNKHYFDYHNNTTGHIFEGAIAYKSEKCPLSLLVATMLYGADKQYTNPSENNYSTYIELGYPVKINNNQKLDLFLGCTPFDGFYGDGYGGVTSFGIVNAGITGSKIIRVSETTEIPVKASLITNPMHEKIYLVFGITL
ncbi:MAG: hypothetical protein NTW49_14295 [Bacteroidia bacterium]|nr:hypothetical protein [Bacteroidia bacterium]